MSHRTFLLSVLLSALMVRLGFIFLLPQTPVGADAHSYDTIAVNLAAGNGFSINPGIPTPSRAPLYPLFLSAVYHAGGHNYTLVRIMQAFLSALTCLVMYYIGKELFAEQIARLSAILSAFYPILIAYTGLILSETLFIFLFALAVLLLCRAFRHGTIIHVVPAGIFLGLATLTRPTTMLFPFFLAISYTMLSLTLSQYSKEGGSKNRTTALFTARHARNWLLLVLAFGLTIAPWTYRNYSHFKRLVMVSTGGGFGIWATGYVVKHNVSWYAACAALHVRMREWVEPDSLTPGVHPKITFDQELVAEGRGMIRQNAGKYLFLLLKRLAPFWVTSHSSVFMVDRPITEYIRSRDYANLMIRLGFLGLHGILLTLGAAGVVIAMIDRREAALLPLLLLVYFTGHIAFDPLPRYHLPVMPYLFLFVSLTLTKAYYRLKQRSFPWKG